MNPSPQPWPPEIADTKVYGGGKMVIEVRDIDPNEPKPYRCPSCFEARGEELQFTPKPVEKTKVTSVVTPNIQMPAFLLRSKLGLITPGELAAALGLQEETLTVWRGSGAGPDYVKLGKKVFYRLDDLNWWVGTKFPETHAKPLVPLAGVDDADAETQVEGSPPKTTGL